MSKYCACCTPMCDKCSTHPECYAKKLEQDCIRDRYECAKRSGVDHDCCGKGYCGVPGLGDNECGDGPREEIFPEKLIFVIELYDNGPDLIKKYLLIFYTVDNSVEIKDMINHQRFLRRMVLGHVQLEDLYLGNIINIYGRKMTITEYADSCTRQYLDPRRQRAFVLVKPHAIPCLGRILRELETRFRVLRARMVQLTPDLAHEFYGYYKSEEFYDRIIDQITSGPVVAILLVGENSIERLLCLAGNLDPGIAKLKHPSSLRALFGKDFVLNAIHVSESPGCVEKDSAMFFTDCRKEISCLAPGTAVFKCSTCCVIKPHAVKDFMAGAAIDCILRGNFKITALEFFYLDRSHAEEFYEIYKGVLPEYSDMTAELAVGPCYALEISGCGEDTVTLFRDFCGPRDPVLASKLYPKSLRAKFGSSTIKNGVHCTDLCEDAEMEVEYFFCILQMVGF